MADQVVRMLIRVLEATARQRLAWTRHEQATRFDADLGEHYTLSVETVPDAGGAPPDFLIRLHRRDAEVMRIPAETINAANVEQVWKPPSTTGGAASYQLAKEVWAAARNAADAGTAHAAMAADAIERRL